MATAYNSEEDWVTTSVQPLTHRVMKRISANSRKEQRKTVVYTLSVRTAHCLQMFHNTWASFLQSCSFCSWDTWRSQHIIFIFASSYLRTSKNIYLFLLILWLDRPCGPVVRVPACRSRGSGSIPGATSRSKGPGSIPSATRFSEK
jgi:hypothetical protein